MILTIDVGNSNIVTIGYSETGEILFNKRETTLKCVKRDEYLNLFVTMKKEINSFVNKIVLSCVVPSMCDHIVSSLEEVFEQKVDVLLKSKVPQLNVALDDPNELGADFVATTLGAYEKYDKPVIIVDMGSATKISVVDRQMNFLGGVIQPGIGIMSKALNDHIPHLPPIEIKRPKLILGRNTIECIQSGIINGAKASVIELSNQIEKEIGQKCERVITGGYSNLFYDTTSFKVDPHLLNDGLYYYSQRSKIYEQSKN